MVTTLRTDGSLDAGQDPSRICLTYPFNLHGALQVEQTLCAVTTVADILELNVRL